MLIMTISKVLILAVLVGCLCFCSTVLAARELSDDLAMVARHEQWMLHYSRVYRDAAEKAQRFEVFRANVKFIESFNSLNKKFWLGINQFADLTNDEFKTTKINDKRFRPNTVRVPTGFRYENVSTDDLPATVDWRSKGAVTHIEDEGPCSCCWGFSAVAAMEGIVKLTTGKLFSLSTQEIADCDGEDQACYGGGDTDDAFKFIIKNGGLATASNYSHATGDEKCKRVKSVATIKGYEDVPTNDEAALMKAVANQPVSVTVDGGDRAFQFYSGGVMTGFCGTDLNHGIAAIGYGTASDGTKYWIMKNSWGTSWGEKGYARMEKDIADKRGMCGLAMQPSYPTE
ncbi:hypothetical protein ACP70R_009322 [Stipagrostis hirtigluma subsp. patula]